MNVYVFVCRKHTIYCLQLPLLWWKKNLYEWIFFIVVIIIIRIAIIGNTNFSLLCFSVAIVCVCVSVCVGRLKQVTFSFLFLSLSRHSLQETTRFNYRHVPFFSNIMPNNAHNISRNAWDERGTIIGISDMDFRWNFVPNKRLGIMNSIKKWKFYAKTRDLSNQIHFPCLVNIDLKVVCVNVLSLFVHNFS